MLNYLYILPFFPSFGNNEHVIKKEKLLRKYQSILCYIQRHSSPVVAREKKETSKKEKAMVEYNKVENNYY